MVWSSGWAAGTQDWKSGAKFLVFAFWCLPQVRSLGTSLPLFQECKMTVKAFVCLKNELKLLTDYRIEKGFYSSPCFKLFRTCTS